MCVCVRARVQGFCNSQLSLAAWFSGTAGKRTPRPPEGAPRPGEATASGWAGHTSRRRSAGGAGCLQRTGAGLMLAVHVLTENARSAVLPSSSRRCPKASHSPLIQPAGWAVPRAGSHAQPQPLLSVFISVQQNRSHFHHETCKGSCVCKDRSWVDGKGLPPSSPTTGTAHERP